MDIRVYRSSSIKLNMITCNLVFFFMNRQILLNVIPARRKVWTKQDINGAAYRW